ncbi:MAG TPA: RHS repeat-associated core domain-containing protein, partial [Planctomycetaceae bacterium]
MPATGRLLSAADGDSSLSYTYDDAGRLLTASNGGVTVPLTTLTSTYDDLGRRDSLAATAGGQADFRNEYLYDAAGRMTRLTQQGQAGGRSVAAKRVDLGYDALGRVTGVTRYADLAGSLLVAATEYAYDPSGRLSRLRHATGTTVIADDHYGYDFAGRLLWSRSDADTVAYAYDPTGQLSYADHSGQPDESYGYDATGNRAAAGYEASTGNRVTETATHLYEFDDAGNRTRRTEKATGAYETYAWDHRTQLTKVEKRTSAGALVWSVSYRYDAFARLVERSADGDGNGIAERVERFVYDAAPGKGGLDDVVLVFDGAGSVTHRSLHGPEVDQVFADESAVDGILWALSDRQGTVRDWAKRDVSTGTTSVYNHVELDSFGNVESQTNAGHEVTVGHAGRYHDPLTGLVWHLHRWRDPQAAWLSPDPIGFEGGDPNLGRFVGNSPTNATDPSGLQVRLQEGESVPAKFLPKGPTGVPKRLDGPWEVSIVGSGDGFHCWIRYQSLDNPDEVHTAGRYASDYGGRYDANGNELVPPVKTPGIQWDRDLMKEDGYKSGLWARRSMVVYNPEIYVGTSPYGYSKWGNNCSTYARDAWYFYSREY